VRTWCSSTARLTLAEPFAHCFLSHAAASSTVV
jgi:hypothetical protein